MYEQPKATNFSKSCEYISKHLHVLISILIFNIFETLKLKQSLRIFPIAFFHKWPTLMEIFKRTLMEFQLMVLMWELEGIDPYFAIPQEIYPLR
ncbi:hypothetical protein LguiA_002730 [Lonicera macranthoides]